MTQMKMAPSRESRRRTILAGALAAGVAALGALWPRSAAAARIWRVGLVDTHPRGDGNGIAREFVDAMTRLGYLEGRDVEYLHRHLQRIPGLGDETHAQRLAALAEDLVRERPDAIVTAGTPLTKALARATTTIPIVTNVGDAVGAGFARSIARPGGNITGVALAMGELYEKSFEHLKAIIPGPWSLASGVGEYTHQQPYADTIAGAARKCAIPMRAVSFMGMDPAQADRALASLRSQGVRVLDYWGRIAGINEEDALQFATKYGLVVFPGHPDQVPKGALLMHEAADEDAQQRKALQLVKILRGTPPGDIPFDTSTRFRLLLNRRTAGLMGFTIPREILLIADKVYD